MTPLSREMLEQRRRENGARRAGTSPAFPDAQKAKRSTATSRIADRYADMNKTERKRAEELDAMKHAGEILDWWGGKVSGITLKLAHDTRYTPDFLIQERDGSLRLEEIKGFFRDDAKVKTKVCAAMYPFPLRVLKLVKGAWQIQEVK
jgi:hypothetical protein